MRETKTEILIVGGGTGGVAAALAALELGRKVTLTEETDWIGGQLSAQLVPPDEHPWIESFGRTRTYADLRESIRRSYGGNVPPNPGGGWVSDLCFEPHLADLALRERLAPHLASGLLRLLEKHIPADADCSGDHVRAVRFADLETGHEHAVHADYVLDATETGDLLPMTLTEYVLGAESRRETGEPSARDEADEHDVQSLTHVFAIAHDEGADHTIAQPEGYERWRAYRPAMWPGPLLGFDDLDPRTNEPRHLPFDRLFTYRQIVDPAVRPGQAPATAVNWPMNDYMEGRVIDVPDDVRQKRLAEAKELSLSLLYWLQTEGGRPGLRLAPELSGTPDGFAKTPYHREGRRIRAKKTIVETDVTADGSRDRGVVYDDSVGVGAYRIDLHPSAAGRPYLDLSTVPFTIPLGALIPERVENLLPAAKNIGTTHITNGCYRLHPVEWNIGEVAGALAAICMVARRLPCELLDDRRLFEDFRRILHARGVETQWPDVPLRAL